MNTADILSRADAGETVAAIAAGADVTAGRVYAVLRKHRPNRARKLRVRTSRIPDQIRALDAIGTKPARIAFLLDVRRQYVYRILGEPISVDSKRAV